jgi:hypothetical protein
MDAGVFAALWPLLLECDRVHLQGWGEPLLHPRFLAMARSAVRAGCKVSTTTSGTVMTRELAAGIVDSGIDIVAFSLAGTTSGTHDRARPGAAFDKVLEAAATLAGVRAGLGGSSPRVHLAYMLLAGDVAEAEALPDIMERMGVRCAVASTLDYLPSAAWAGEAFTEDGRPGIAAAREVLTRAAARADARGMRLHFSLSGEDGPAPCAEQAQDSVYVDVMGTLRPCVYHGAPGCTEGVALGGVPGTSPIDVVRGGLRKFREGLVGGWPEGTCRTCLKRKDASGAFV